MKKDTKQQHKHKKQKLHIITTTIKQTDTPKHTATSSTNPHKHNNKTNRQEEGHETTSQTH